MHVRRRFFLRNFLSLILDGDLNLLTKLASQEDRIEFTRLGLSEQLFERHLTILGFALAWDACLALDLAKGVMQRQGFS